MVLDSLMNQLNMLFCNYILHLKTYLFETQYFHQKLNYLNFFDLHLEQKLIQKKIILLKKFYSFSLNKLSFSIHLVFLLKITESSKISNNPIPINH